MYAYISTVHTHTLLSYVRVICSPCQRGDVIPVTRSKVTPMRCERVLPSQNLSTFLFWLTSSFVRRPRRHRRFWLLHTLHTPISISPSTSFFFFTHCQVDHGLFCLHIEPAVTVRRRYKCIHARVGFHRETKLRHNVTRSQDCQHWRRYAFEYTCSSR
jgi:hypothetical protein